MRGKIGIAVTVMLLGAATASAQDDGASLTGRWTGQVSEPGAAPRSYRMQANIVVDRDGAPIGTVRYERLHCAGAWVRASTSAANWRLQEVITNDPGARCAPQMDVSLEPASHGLIVRWSEPGSDEVVATAFLRRGR